MAAEPGVVRRRVGIVRRALRWTALALSPFALIWACSSAYILAFTPPPGPVALQPLDGSSTRRVYVMAWGHHSSIFVEQPPGWRLGPEGNETAPFVEYGWGDRSFYMESNFAPTALFASAMLPTESVVYVCGHELPPNETVIGADVIVRDCTAAELTRLITVLEGQMVRTADGGRPAVFPATPEYPGRFYPGRESYVIWWNCNMWTVRMLAESGFDASPFGVVWKSQVCGRVRGFTQLPMKLSRKGAETQGIAETRVLCDPLRLCAFA